MIGSRRANGIDHLADALQAPLELLQTGGSTSRRGMGGCRRHRGRCYFRRRGGTGRRGPRPHTRRRRLRLRQRCSWQRCRDRRRLRCSAHTSGDRSGRGRGARGQRDGGPMARGIALVSDAATDDAAAAAAPTTIFHDRHAPAAIYQAVRRLRAPCRRLRRRQH